MAMDIADPRWDPTEQFNLFREHLWERRLNLKYCASMYHFTISDVNQWLSPNTITHEIRKMADHVTVWEIMGLIKISRHSGQPVNNWNSMWTFRYYDPNCKPSDRHYNAWGDDLD